METVSMPFNRQVLLSRKMFLRRVKELPKPFNKVASRHLNERFRHSANGVLLGEYTPWLFADALGVKNNECVLKFVQAWLNIYSYVVFIDDTIDRKNLPYRDLLSIAAGLLLQRGLSQLGKLVPDENRDSLMNAAGLFLKETAAAAGREISERTAWSSYPKHLNVKRLGKKVAVLKLCVTYLELLRGEAGSTVKLVFVDSLGGAMQLLDDVSDWEEDCLTGSYTYPLATTFRKLASKRIIVSPSALSPDALLAAMVITRALEQTVAIANSALSDVLKQLRVKPGSITETFLRGVIVKNNDFRMTLEETRQLLTSKDFNWSATWFTELSKNLMARKQLNRLRRSFSIVAQSS